MDVGILFVVTSTGCESVVLDPCFLICFYIYIYSSPITLPRKKRDGCFTLIMLWLSVFYVPSLRCSGSLSRL